MSNFAVLDCALTEVYLGTKQLFQQGFRLVTEGL